jgi:hypothetical protein
VAAQWFMTTQRPGYAPGAYRLCDARSHWGSVGTQAVHVDICGPRIQFPGDRGR